MSRHFYIKKFREHKEGTLPLFVVRRSSKNSKIKEAFQVRYAGINKTFPTVEASLVFTEKILNNQLEDIKKFDLIIGSVCDDEKQEITVTLKGVDRDDYYFFSEKYKRGIPLHFQQETFEFSCCIVWKLYFMKFNSDYRLTLLRKNWIGSNRVKQTSKYIPNKSKAKVSPNTSVNQTMKLF